MIVLTGCFSITSQKSTRFKSPARISFDLQYAQAIPKGQNSQSGNYTYKVKL